MRVLFFGNNWLAWKILDWLKKQSIELIGIVLHPAGKQKYAKELLEIAELPDERIFWGHQLRDTSVRNSIRSLKPDLGLSILFGYIFDPQLIECFPCGIINLHPSYLPYNRGQYPNVWSIIENTPAGVTLHYVNSGIDTGEIIAQSEVEIEAVDTGKSLYHKLERYGFELFKNTWPSIQGNQITYHKQVRNEGTFHITKDIDRIDHIQLDRLYTARELIDILRARTFPPYKGAFFMDRGRKVYLRLHLSYDNEFSKEQYENAD